MLSFKSHGSALEVLVEVSMTRRVIPQMVEDLCDAITDRSPETVVLNLASVDEIDSSGLAGLVKTWRSCEARGQRMVLIGLQPAIASMFRLTKVDTLIPVVDDPDAAPAI
jgi:anti-sigma B factor antagonist